MPYSYDPREQGPASSPGQFTPDVSSAPTWKLTPASGMPPGNQPPPVRPGGPSRPPGLNNRKTWYIVSGIALLAVIVGIVFAGPLRPGLSKNPGPSSTSGTNSPNSQPKSETPTPARSYDSVDSRLFADNSPWNVPIGANVQLDPNSNTWAAQLSGGTHVPTISDFGMPIYTSTASDPTYTVNDPSNDHVFQDNQPIHIPDIAAPSPGSDHWLFIYDTTKNLIFEMWDTSKSGGTWTTQTGNVYTPGGDGVLQVDGSQQEGNGASYFGGVVTDADIKRGTINHALSFAIQDTSTSWRFPMHASDGHNTDPSAVPMGARLQLDPSFDCNSLPADQSGEKMVCKALQTYGGYVRDTGGVTLSMYFEGEDLKDPDRNPPNGSPGDAGRTGGLFDSVGLHDAQDLTDIPWDKLRVLKDWNSFTAVSNVPSSSSPALAGFPPGSASMRLALSNATELAIAEEASWRYRQTL